MQLPPSKNFAKIILPPPIHAKQLRIPAKFATSFGDELSSSATISVPCGESWVMGLNKCDKDVCFCYNWPEFAKHYSIGCGFIVVFKYEGDSRFRVRIFDTTASEISYPPYTTRTAIAGGPSHRKRSRTAEYDDEHQHQASYETRSKKRRRRGQNQIQDEIIDDAAAVADDDYVIDLARKKEQIRSTSTFHGRQGKNRCNQNDIDRVSNTLTTTIKRWSVYIPAHFAAKHLKLEDSIKLQNCNGEEWDVSCVPNCANSAGMRLVTGWGEFARENNMSEGDLCEFEVIKRKPAVVLKVTNRSDQVEIIDDDANINVINLPRMKKRRSVSTSTSLGRQVKSRRYNQNGNTGRVSNSFKATIGRGIVYIHAQFAARYPRLKGSVKLKNCNGEEWDVSCVPHGAKLSGRRLGMGWGEFARENHVSEGDVCEFEVIKREPIVVLKVTNLGDQAEIIDAADNSVISLPRKKKQKSTFHVRPGNSRCNQNRDTGRVSNSLMATIGHWNVYIPAHFAVKHPWLKGSIKLKNCNGEEWDVSCVPNCSHSSAMQLGKGWGKFARENNMSEGDLCEFEVIKRKPVVVLKVTNRSDQAEIIDAAANNSINLPRKKKQRSTFTSLGRRGKSRCNQNRTGSGRASNSLKITIRNCRVYIHAQFAREYMRLKHSAKLRNCNGKEWDVSCFPHGSKSAMRLGKGWNEFARENHVSVGDVCEFTVIKRQPDVVLRVKNLGADCT